MISSKMNTNVKLIKLFYKYTEDKKEEQPEPIKEEKNIVEEDYEAYPPYNFSWFIEKKVAAMGWPQTVANLNYLADVGVDHLITLSPEKIPPILECKKKLRWSEIRIKEFGAPTLRQILKFIEICERAEIRGEVLGIHCRQGRGRTGTLLACYLVHFKNMAPERAVMTVRVQRPGSCETYEQEKAVCHYHDCLRGTLDKPDYRMVDDKLYFDAYMRNAHSDDEDAGKQEKQDGVQNGGEEQKQEKKKTKAMVINHKIYF